MIQRAIKFHIRHIRRRRSSLLPRIYSLIYAFGWAQKLWAGYYPLNLEGFVSKSLLCLRCFCSSTVVLMGHGDICRQQASSREEAPSEGSRQDLNRIWIQQLLVLVRSEFNKSRFDKKFPTKNVKQMHENGGVSVFFLIFFIFSSKTGIISQYKAEMKHKFPHYKKVQSWKPTNSTKVLLMKYAIKIKIFKGFY